MLRANNLRRSLLNHLPPPLHTAFDISAVRVPSEVCSTLENRLLNWPRIRNIARVTSDEIDEEIREILPQSRTETLVALNRRIYGKSDGDGEPLNAVQYREKLAKTFNSRGYANFRNLAKISRPKKKKERGDGGEKREMKGGY